MTAKSSLHHSATNGAPESPVYESTDDRFLSHFPSLAPWMLSVLQLWLKWRMSISDPFLPNQTHIDAVHFNNLTCAWDMNRFDPFLQQSSNREQNSCQSRMLVLPEPGSHCIFCETFKCPSWIRWLPSSIMSYLVLTCQSCRMHSCV